MHCWMLRSELARRIHACTLHGWMIDWCFFCLGRVTDSEEPPASGGHTDKVMMIEEEDE